MSEADFLRQAAEYFRNRGTKGEDAAFWANVFNAENCEKAAARIDALEAEVARITQERDDAKDDALRLHREKMDEIDKRIAAETEARQLRTYIQPMLDALLEAADKFTVFFYDFKDGSPEKEVCDRNRKLCIETYKNFRAALSPASKEEGNG